MCLFFCVYSYQTKEGGFSDGYLTLCYTQFSSDILSRIKLIISDGDQQECGSIDNAIGMFMQSAKRGRCGWHIVNRNFNTHVLARSCFPVNGSDYDNVTLIIQNWIYSWMKDDYEIREEFIYSKQQLSIFVNSDYVSSRLGSVFSGSVNIYL